MNIRTKDIKNKKNYSTPTINIVVKIWNYDLYRSIFVLTRMENGSGGLLLNTALPFFLIFTTIKIVL